MRVDVAFTPDEAGAAPTGIVIDVIRATSTICQALASGYERVFCTAEVDEARALRSELGEGVLGGERKNVVIPGFDLGNSPREYGEPLGQTLILSTTNGTRAIVGAAQRSERTLVASLLNLAAVTEEVRRAGTDAVVVCAGVQGTLALDDAYCAGRVVQLLDGDRSDAALAAELVACSFPTALEALNARTYGPPGLEEDIAFCARESVLDVVPRFARMVGTAAEITLPEV